VAPRHIEKQKILRIPLYAHYLLELTIQIWLFFKKKAKNLPKSFKNSGDFVGLQLEM
jgi:hypothetical protein